MLERHGWYVTINAPLKTAILSRLNEVRPDALVVDLEGASDHDMEVLKFLLPRCTVPVLIADDEIRQALTSESELAERFNEKLEAVLARRFTPAGFDRAVSPAPAAPLSEPALRAAPVPPVGASVPAADAPPPVAREPAAVAPAEPPAAGDPAPSNVIETPYFSVGAPAAPEPAPASTAGEGKRRGKRRAGNVWVLGASLGGPQAVARFLGGLPPDLDVGFVLVQRIGPQHVPMLARQLNNRCALDVRPATDGHVLRSGEVLVAPVDRRIALGANGRVKLLDVAQTTAASALDHAIQSAARRYRANAGAIVFSGMGDDGSRSCHAMLDAGGAVWTQDSESCVIDSMPKHVRLACKVGFSAEPEVLAARLVEKLSVADYPRAGGVSA